ncbi:MAG TPA: hypothetical protein PKY31_12370, partial [Spirochaetota bacterium]|nr:hypothetical protein [Spirochaetota bacterium]
MIRTASVLATAAAITALISCATYPDRIEVTDLVGAAREGTIDDVKRELARGAYIDCMDEEYHTPLMHAIHRGRNDMAAFLIARG